MFQEVQPYKDSVIMRKDPYGNYITCLTGKQFCQLRRISAVSYTHLDVYKRQW